MDITLASDGGIVQIPHALSDYDSLEGVVADVAAATGMVNGNVLLFTEDGRELKQEVLEELWERGGHGAGSSIRRQTVYLFNRETFFSDPERWAAELREDVVLPPPLELSGRLDTSQAQAPFASAYDHMCHLQSLFRAQAHALNIAYDNLAYHLEPILNAFRDFAGRTEDQLAQQERLLAGYSVDMAMLPKVVVHDALFRRRDRDRDNGSAGGDERRKTLVDWIHAKKMEQVRDHCQSAHSDYVSRYNVVSAEMEELEIQTSADRQQATHRIQGVEHEFSQALERIELASQQVDALILTDSRKLTSVPELTAADLHDSLQDLDQALREDLASMTAVKNDFTLDLHVHLRQIANYQVRMTKFTRPMTELDADLRQKNAFPHLARLHNLPFVYAANIIELVHRRDFATVLGEWVTRLARALNDVLASESQRRRDHKAANTLPWEIAALDESQSARVDITVPGSQVATYAAGLSKRDVDNLFRMFEQMRSDPEFQNLDGGTENPIPPLLEQMSSLIANFDITNHELGALLDQAAANTSAAPNEVENLRASNAEYERRIAEMERVHQDQLEAHEARETALRNRQAELQEELVRLRTDLSDEMHGRQQLAHELEEKTTEFNDRMRDQEEQGELVAALQADITQEKDRATDLGVRLQEALLDVDGLRSAEQTLVTQIREMQEERTRILTDLGEAQLQAQNYESELAGTRAELEATGAQLHQAQLDRDQALKNQSAEAERLMRDHIAEADGDRAVLEHQNLTLTKELETARASVDEKLNAAKNAAIRREDGLKAELSFTKAQLREVQRRETVLQDELAMSKEATAALQQKETHQVELARDAVTLAGKYHEASQRLMGVISSSTTIAGSLSLPARSKTPPPAISTGSSDLKDSSVLVRCLETAGSFDLDAFTDAVLKTINLARKLSKSCKQYRELSRNKITISNFGKGDLVLFLPTRNAGLNAWAAFNISAPHHFLNVNDAIRQQIVGKDYFLARITGTDEAVVNGDAPETNPYGLAEGLRYYSHQAEEWTPGPPRVSRRSMSAIVPTAASPVVAEPPKAKARSNPPSTRPSPPRAASPQQHSSPHTNSSPPTASSPPPPSDEPAGEGVSETPASPPPVGSRHRSPPPQHTPAIRSPLGTSPIARAGGIGQASSRPLSPRAVPEQRMTSPGPPPSSPTTPFNPSTGTPSGAAPFAAGPIAVRSGGARRSQRPSISSAASPPARDVPASALARPSSVASSAGSYAARGLPIPVGAAKGAPAAPVATSTSADGSPSPSSFDSPFITSRRVSKKSSVTSLKKGEEFKPSPLKLGSSSSPVTAAAPSPAGRDVGSRKSSGTGTGAAASPPAPPPSGSGFLSGLSLSRRRHSGAPGPDATQPPPHATAVDLLKRLEGGS